MAYFQCNTVENSTANDIVCMGGKCRQWTVSSKTNTHLDVYRLCCIHSLHMQMQVHMQLVIRGIISQKEITVGYFLKRSVMTTHFQYA